MAHRLRIAVIGLPELGDLLEEAGPAGAEVVTIDRGGDVSAELATRARNSHQAGSPAEREADLAELHEALAEADQAWKAWHETGFILDARPDLVFVRQDHGRAN